MIEKNQVYRFKEEFCSELEIPTYHIERRKQDLLEWLENFFEFKILEGRPIRIQILEILGEYKQMPRKVPLQTKLTQQKKEDYEKFTIAALGPNFKPNSKTRVAREAIDAFGYEKYAHINDQAVASRYIAEPFNKYGQSDGKKIWVYYSNYEPLDKDVVQEWRKILEEEHIGEEEAASAFYTSANGGNVEKEIGYFKSAVNRFKELYGDTPVLVSRWRLRQD